MNTSFIEHLAATKNNPEFTGSISMGRQAETTVGLRSVAVGNNASATGNYSGAIGNYTVAGGNGAVAVGNKSEASGNNSFASGEQTIANHRSQVAFGEYNIQDPNTNYSGRGTYAEIVGNGISSSARSNARTLDWDGNEVLAGKLTVGAGPTDNMDVATKQYVDNFIKSGSMIFKGTIGSSGATVDSLPQIHEAGWMYLVSTAGTYLNKTCEVGDMIVCVRTSNGNLSTDWTIIQNNINPELYATKEYVDTGIQNIDLSAYAPKANPEFSGSISLSRQSDSTVGANSLAVGTGTEATELCSQAVGFYTKATGQFQHVSGKYNARDSIITQHDETATYNSGRYVYVRGRYRDNNTWYYVLNIYKCTVYHTGDTPTSEGSLPSSHWTYVYGVDSTSQPQLPFNTINAEIVGIGSDDGHRKNGRTLDWNGNEWLAGRLTVGAGPVSNMDVTTKQYVDNAVQSIDLTSYATKASPVFTSSITIGGTTITEAQLQALVAMANDDPIGTTWVFNDEITFPSDDLFIENTDGLFYFDDNESVPYYSISIDKSSADSPKITYHDQFGDEAAYMFGVWNSNDYKTITFTGYIDTATPSIKAFMTWLRANATKAGDTTSATGVSF